MPRRRSPQPRPHPVAIGLAIGLALASLAIGACARDESPRAPSSVAPPNVVVISIDCLNHRQFDEAVREGLAPALARLRADSLDFSRAYAHAPWTTPSHMSLFTGLYPSQHGWDTPYTLMIEFANARERVDHFATLATRLHDLGYETVAFTGKGTIAARFGVGRGFERYVESRKDDQNRDLPQTVARLRTWLDGRSERPFFLFLHTFDVHQRRPKAHSGDGEVIAYVSRHLDAVLGELRRRGLYDDSLIVFTGDHGSHMVHTEGKCCTHGAGHYDENLHVPLLLKLPGSGARGPRDALVRHVDVFPTVMEAVTGVADANGGRGRSLLSVGEGAPGARYSFSEADSRCVRRYALTTKRFKYIYTPRTAMQAVLRANRAFNDRVCRRDCPEMPAVEELYDLDADPSEENDLLADGEAAGEPPVLAELRAAMEAHRNLERFYRRRVVLGPQAEPLDPGLVESLRALGYLE